MVVAARGAAGFEPTKSNSGMNLWSTGRRPLGAQGFLQLGAHVTRIGSRTARPIVAALLGLVLLRPLPAAGTQTRLDGEYGLWVIDSGGELGVGWLTSGAEEGVLEGISEGRLVY